MSDDLLPITEADVVGQVTTLIGVAGDEVAVRAVLPDEPRVVLGWPNGHSSVASMALVVACFRKRAPKPPRCVVEWIVPDDGDEYLTPRGKHTALNVTEPHWVVVEELS